MSDLVTIGWLTLDDIVLPDGTFKQKVLGGGALYSAVGASIWAGDVGVHATTGDLHLRAAKEAIASYGLSAEGVYAIPGHGLELWLLHESATDKQQVPKLTSATAERMDERRPDPRETYPTARGYHLAPQTPKGHSRNLTALKALSPAPILTMDILSDAYVDAGAYADLSTLAHLNAFLPSQEEVGHIWRPDSMPSWMLGVREAYPHVALVVKLGHRGSLVLPSEATTLYHVPCYPAATVDTTGAGDAFCGGFLAGLVQGKSATECAVMGTVSASYVVEAYGALETYKPSPKERDERWAYVQERVHTYG